MSEFFIIGPCALESMDQVKPLVSLCKRWNLEYFRAHIFKPRTNPFSFQGIGLEGLPIVDYIKSEGLKIVCEACSISQLEVIAEFSDVIQIGARNMQNFELLKAVGKNKNVIDNDPYIILKRGFANTYYEWISSAKYLEESGIDPKKIILCERGSRNSSSLNGVVLDFAIAFQALQKSGYKVIIDPSHGTKISEMVIPMAKAVVALEFDGVMIEVHPTPEKSLSDRDQAISILQLEEYLELL